MIIPNIVTHKGTVARRCAGFAALLKVFNYAGEYIFLYSVLSCWPLGVVPLLCSQPIIW